MHIRGQDAEITILVDGVPMTLGPTVGSFDPFEPYVSTPYELKMLRRDRVRRRREIRAQRRARRRRRGWA